MKLHKLLVASIVSLTLLLATAATSNAQSKGLRLPPHEKIVLKNGLTVLLLEKHGIPFISVYALVKTGSDADPDGLEGLASVTTDLLRKGTKIPQVGHDAADKSARAGDSRPRHKGDREC